MSHSAGSRAGSRAEVYDSARKCHLRLCRHSFNISFIKLLLGFGSIERSSKRAFVPYYSHMAGGRCCVETLTQYSQRGEDIYNLRILLRESSFIW